MRQRFRRGFSAAEKTELGDRGERSESLNAIVRALGNAGDVTDQSDGSQKRLRLHSCIVLMSMSLTTYRASRYAVEALRLVLPASL